MPDVSKLNLDGTTYKIKDDDARKYLVVVNNTSQDATKVNITTSDEVVELALQEDIIPKMASPDKYGAVGDGITDDSTAVQACIDENAITVLNKNYYCASNIILKPTKKLFAAKRNGGLTFGNNARLILKICSEIRGGNFVYNGSSDNYLFEISESGVLIDGVYASSTSWAVLFGFATTEMTTITNSLIETTNGIRMLSRQIDIYASNCRFTCISQTGTALQIDSGSCEAFEFNQCNFVSFAQIFRFGSASAIKYSVFNTCYFDNMQTTGLALNANSSNNSFVGCWFSTRSGYAFNTNGASSLIIVACIFANNCDNSPGAIVITNNSKKISINACAFKNNTRQIRIENNTDTPTVIISNCVVEKRSDGVDRFVEIARSGDAYYVKAIISNNIIEELNPAFPIISGDSITTVNNIT